MSESIEITDVTLRDGLQMEAKVLPIEDKKKLFDHLTACGHSRIEVTSYSHPKWMPQFADSELFSAGLKSAKPNDEWMAFIPNEKGLERLLKSPIGWASAFIATSEAFNQKNINASIAETVTSLKSIVERTKAAKRKIRIYVSTVFGCPYEGKIADKKLFDTLDAVVELKPDEIALSDTIGVGTPKDVARIVAKFAKAYPLKNTALHLHNTYGLALANAQAGYEAGVRKFDGSTGGVGGCPYAKGAAGNVATEELAYAFYRQGALKEFRAEAIQKTLELLRGELGISVQSRLGEIASKGGTWYGLK